ncbi:type 1 fimbrial protein [Pantoea sp. JGM49]|uniref:fimbrial protein n=1 Tax=Pantoea sp. JGM49 TaxID=2799791 RepID=UPI001BA82AE8|nr:fimbrial protein [Pantoea sp. JGM49]MBS0881228.1 type 1 fimbrial protein [Pantoea sp. JGM49]
MALLFSPLALAVFKNGTIESHFGVLRVYGTLTESACYLDMHSADQSIDLGNITTANFHNVGDQGPLIPVSLKLHDCLRNASDPQRERDNVAWSAHQPAVSFSFTGVEDAANPQLFQAQGVKGIGLRLKDASLNNIIIGQRGKPVLLKPDDSQVVYYITAERTRGELRAGNYSANINFRLSYE